MVRNNEAILDKVLLTIKRGKRSYSASDGGFLTYRAKFFEKDGNAFVAMRLFESDYAALPVSTNNSAPYDPYGEVKVYPVSFASGEIEIDGVRYKRKTLSRVDRQRLLDLLSNEPLEKQR